MPQETLVQPLPASVPNIEWMRVCAHEIGHAVAADAANIDVGTVRVWFGWRGVHGFANFDSELYDDDDQDTINGWLVALLAGREAGALCLHHYLGTPLGDAHDIETGNSEHDLREIRQIMRYTGTPVKRLKRDAEKLVQRYWHRIDQHASRLAHKRTLRGSSV